MGNFREALDLNHVFFCFKQFAAGATNDLHPIEKQTAANSGEESCTLEWISGNGYLWLIAINQSY